MCEQREKLLAYVYDEGDAGERAEVQRHLDQCPDCRAEIAGLRSVRSDLLAWEVPAHDPVWRPFDTTPAVPWWRQVPAWAMATAAAVVLLLGATGSVVAHAMMPERTVARETASPAPAPTATPIATMADLTAAEQRLLAKLNLQLDEVGANVRRVSNSNPSVQTIEGDHDRMVERLMQLQENYQAQLRIIENLRQELSTFKRSTTEKQANTASQIGNLTYLVAAQGK